MTFLSTKELYAIFLTSDFWKDLSFQCKLAAAGKCSKCPCRRQLQAHHKVYRPNWFDTQVVDLECLCRNCHRNEHGIPNPPSQKKRRKKSKHRKRKRHKPAVFNPRSVYRAIRVRRTKWVNRDNSSN